MRTTKIIVLETLADVENFCGTLLRLKGEAPKSLQLTVAITAEQETVVVPPVGCSAQSGGHHIQTTLDKLDRPKVGKIVKKAKIKRPSRKPRPKQGPRRRARPATTTLELK